MRFWVEVRRKKWVDVKQKARPAGDSRTEGRSQGMTCNLENALRKIEEIHRLISELADVDYEHRTLPGFLLLLEQGEEFVQNFRDFLGDR